MTGLLSLDDALHIIASKVQPLTECEIIPLEEALGRVVWTDICAPYALPPFDNTGVDGYAFCHAEIADLKIVGSSFAGEPFAGEVSVGTAVHIATGAVLPENADTVVMQENCEILDGICRMKQIPAKGSNIRPKGADIREGEIVLPRGQILQPQHIALLGALGFKTVSVFREIKIAIASTGQELKTHGATLQTGQIIDTNGLMLKQMIGNTASVTLLDPLPDEYEHTCAALRKAANIYDLIVTSGGVSVGDRDYVHTALKDLGKIHFWKLAIRPGKPVIFGQINQCFCAGLPGNPVSSFVTFLLIVKPLLGALTGRKVVLPPVMKIPLAAALKKDFPLRAFPRVRLEQREDGICALPYKDQSSNLFSSLTTSDGLLDLPEEARDYKAGDIVAFRPLNGWMND